MKGEKKMIFVVVGAVVVAFMGIIKVVLNIKHSAAFVYNDFFNELEHRIDAEKAKLSDKYAGGKCKISADNKNVHANAELYINENGNWYKREISYSVPISHFSKDDMTQSKLNELKISPDQFDIT